MPASWVGAAAGFSYLLASSGALSVAAALAEDGQREPLQRVELCGSGNRRGGRAWLKRPLPESEWLVREGKGGKERERTEGARVECFLSSHPSLPRRLSLLLFLRLCCTFPQVAARLVDFSPKTRGNARREARAPGPGQG